MKRTLVILASITGMVIFSQIGKADTLVGSGGGFQSWSPAVLGTPTNPTYGGPYWNNLSADGPTANIGWCLTGGGSCVISSPPGAIKYYGTDSGNAVQNMSFQSSGSAISVSLVGQFTNQIGVAPNTGYNVFGWYTINPDGTIGAMTSLWNSKTDTIGESATFTPTGHYGLFFENIQGNGLADYFWFMNSTQNYSAGVDKNPVVAGQLFAVFSGTPNEFYVGMEDANGGDNDFQDMIVQLYTTASGCPPPPCITPEPSTLLLSGVGFMLGGGVLLRRRRQTA